MDRLERGAAPPRLDAARPVATGGDPRVDEVTRSALELLAAGVTELVGFDVAAISVAVGDELEVVAVSGNEGARRALEGSRTARHLTEKLVTLAEDWGVLRFVPHERAADYLSRHGWTPDYQSLAVDDAWDAEDMLFAPFLDGSGSIQGLLAVDLPSDGLRPGVAKRRQLERYAVQAGRAVHLAVERARLAEQVELAARARLAVREAARELSLDHLLSRCQETLVDGFRARRLWIHVLDRYGQDRGVLWAGAPRSPDAVPDRIGALGRAAGDHAWRERRVAVFSVDGPWDTGWSPAEAEEVRDYMVAVGVSTSLFVPLTDGRACLGHLVLSRGAGDPDWSEADLAIALDIGHDLGHAVAHARAFEREQALVREMQALDDHKSELMATLSHELKTPLSSILGNLELLRNVDEASADGQRGLAAIERGTRRLGRVVDDLMLLARIGDPDHPLVGRPVDLALIVDDVLHLTAATMAQRSLTVSVRADPHPVLAHGDPHELDRVVTNLVSNATKYTEDGGRIELVVENRGDTVRLTCTDDGLGISPDDQVRLFHEFFRSTNPLALGVPGTGLGLAIVERIVRRHGGPVAIRSRLGHGSSFMVSLPSAAVQAVESDAGTQVDA